jgi:hypothetical protein
MGNSVKAIKGLQPEAGTALAQDVNAPVQTVTVKKTIDYKNAPVEGKSDWQGFMMEFAQTSAGLPKVIPVSARRLLAAAIDAGKKDEVFAETADGMELICFEIGLEGGNPIF